MVINQKINSTLLLEVNDLINNNYFLDLNYIYESLDDSEKQTVDKISNKFKNNIREAKDKESLVEIIKNTCHDVVVEMKKNPHMITTAGYLVLLAFVINTTLATLLALILAPMFGVAVGTVQFAHLTEMVGAAAVAPAVEETIKRMSVKSKATGYHYLLFNLSELTLYISRGISPLARIPALFIYFLNTLIHKRADKLYNLESKKDIDTFRSTITSHTAFNVGGTATQMVVLGITGNMLWSIIAAIAFAIIIMIIQLYKLSNMQEEPKDSESRIGNSNIKSLNLDYSFI